MKRLELWALCLIVVLSRGCNCTSPDTEITEERLKATIQYLASRLESSRDNDAPWSDYYVRGMERALRRVRRGQDLDRPYLATAVLGKNPPRMALYFLDAHAKTTGFVVESGGQRIEAPDVFYWADFSREEKRQEVATYPMFAWTHMIWISFSSESRPDRNDESGRDVVHIPPEVFEDEVRVRLLCEGGVESNAVEAFVTSELREQAMKYREARGVQGSG